MKLLPEPYLRSRDRPLYFGDDPDTESGILSGSLGGCLVGCIYENLPYLEKNATKSFSTVYCSIICA